MLNGFCLMFRRELVSRIGLLDEETFPCGYGEETDLCIRAAACGYHLLVADQTFVFHAKSRSYGTQARDVLAHRGRQALHLKHGAAVVEAAYDAARSHPAMAQIREHFRSLLWSTSAAGP